MVALLVLLLILAVLRRAWLCRTFSLVRADRRSDPVGPRLPRRRRVIRRPAPLVRPLVT